MSSLASTAQSVVKEIKEEKVLKPIKPKIDFDDPEVSFYKSSYFNPSTYENKYETLRSTRAKGIKWLQLNEKQTQNKAIIESMENRISKYLVNKNKTDISSMFSLSTFIST